MAKNQESNILFVTGLPHSGTTILYRMLANHPEFGWLSHFSLRAGELAGRHRLPLARSIHWLGSKCRISWRKPKGVLRELFPSPVEPHGIWNELLPNDKKFFHSLPSEQGQKIRDILIQEQDRLGVAALVIKLPRLTRAIPALARAIPHSQFVHIVRDGRAVASSNRKKFTRSPWGEAGALMRAAEHWGEVEGFVQEYRGGLKDRFYLVRYEDFCKDVHQHLQEIADFVRVSAPTSWIQQAPSSLTSTSRKRIAALDQEEKKEIEKQLGSLLNHYGYL